MSGGQTPGGLTLAPPFSYGGPAIVNGSGNEARPPSAIARSGVGVGRFSRRNPSSKPKRRSNINPLLSPQWTCRTCNGRLELQRT